VEGDIIGHDYFGTERVVDDLRKLPGWDVGLVTISPDDVLRDAETTFISGIRTPQVGTTGTDGATHINAPTARDAAIMI